MPAFNFKRRFAAAVENGIKCQTIRKGRADGRDPSPGDRLVLFTDLRTKQARRLRETTCSSRRAITIAIAGTCTLEGRELNDGQREIIAIADGFESWAELVDWIRDAHGLPFHGFVYTWPKPTVQ